MSVVEAVEVRPRVAAATMFLDVEGRVLMVEAGPRDYVDLPGGMVRDGETPRVAAGRELRRALGLDEPVGRLLVADWWLDSPDGVGGAKVVFVFDGGMVTPDLLARIAVDGDVATGYVLCAAAELRAVTVPRLANRVSHAIAARRSHSIRYLEDGCLSDDPAA